MSHVYNRVPTSESRSRPLISPIFRRDMHHFDCNLVDLKSDFYLFSVMIWEKSLFGNQHEVHDSYSLTYSFSGQPIQLLDHRPRR